MVKYVGCLLRLTSFQNTKFFSFYQRRFDAKCFQDGCNVKIWFSCVSRLETMTSSHHFSRLWVTPRWLYSLYTGVFWICIQTFFTGNSVVTELSRVKRVNWSELNILAEAPAFHHWAVIDISIFMSFVRVFGFIAGLVRNLNPVADIAT